MRKKPVRITEPTLERLEDWERQAIDDFHDDNWLGRPETSVELYVLDGSRVPDADSFNRLEPHIQDLQVFACLKDISDFDFNQVMHENENYRAKISQLERDLLIGGGDMPGFLAAKYDNFPERELNYSFFFEDLEMENFQYNASVVEQVENLFQGSEDYVLKGVDFESHAKGKGVEGALEELEQNLSFRLFFMYRAEQEVVDKYNELRREYGDENEYPGIHGTTYIGDERPHAFLSESQELSIDGREVENWLAGKIGNTVGANSTIRRKNTG